MGLKIEETSTETETTEEIEAPEASEGEGASDAAGDESGDGGSEEDAVVIDGIKFKSEKDALEWALENKSKLENERALADAYRTGIQDATATRGSEIPAAPSAPPAPFITEEDFYQNPIEALEKVKKAAKDEAHAELTRAQATKEADRQIWDEFTTAHPDLAEFRTDVELIANSPEHLPVIQALIRTKGQRAGYDYVAQKTRAKFQAYLEASKNKVVLPRGNGTGSTPTGAGKSVTPPKKTEKVLSFREQLRQHNSRFHRHSE